MKPLYHLLLAATAMVAFNLQASTQEILVDTVFAPMDCGSQFYRIPVLSLTPDSTALLAIADRRWDSIADLPSHIDVVARRSTDGGLTWSEQIVVAEADSIGGYGDPCVITDRRTGDVIVISTHGNGLWQQTPGQISLSRSTDGGLTWETPRSLNEFIFTDDPTDRSRIHCNSAFASSGNGLQLRDGRMIFALVTRTEGVHDFPCYAIYSDDSGATWHVSDTPATLNGDESKIAELPDGTLVMSIRTRDRSARKFAISADRGRTWSDTYSWLTLPDTSCNGDMISVTLTDGSRGLLHTLPTPPGFRDDVSTYVSTDDAKTWKLTHNLYKGQSAYSSAVQMPDGSVAFLIEEAITPNDDRHTRGYNLVFRRLPLSMLVP